MGPPGFWAELRRRGAGIQLCGKAVEELVEGRKVAIDGSIWLYQAQRQKALVRAFGSHRAALKVFFERCSCWIRKGVLPVVVLEGCGGGRATRFGPRATGGCLSNALADPGEDVRRLLAAIGVPSIDAEGEAEATCAALTKCGACDFVATSDSDALLFGATAVLRSLDLRCNGALSNCELWELRKVEEVCGVNRESLTAAASLIGCDYAKGVGGVGARGAVTAAHALQSMNPSADGSALRALVDHLHHKPTLPRAPSSRAVGCCGCHRCGHGNIRKRQHGPRGCAACGTAQGCLPRLATSGEACECRGCKCAAAAGGRASVAQARLSRRVLSRAESDPMSRRSLHGAQRQYSRMRDPVVGRIIEEEPLAWKGLNESDALEALACVFNTKTKLEDRVIRKLLPLQFEWALRSLAASTPKGTSPDSLRTWAVAQGFKWAPISARRLKQKFRHQGTQAARNAVVYWEPVEIADPSSCTSSGSSVHSIHLSGSTKTAIPHCMRLKLVLSCGLLTEEDRRPSSLMAVFRQLLKECHIKVRSEPAALRSWARHNDIPYVPCAAKLPRGCSVAARAQKQVSVRWAEAAEPGQVCNDLLLELPVKLVHRFGGSLAMAVSSRISHGQKLGKSCGAVALSSGQRSLLDFIRRSTSAEGTNASQGGGSGATAPGTPPLALRHKDQCSKTPAKEKQCHTNMGVCSAKRRSVSSKAVSAKLRVVRHRWARRVFDPLPPDERDALEDAWLQRDVLEDAGRANPDLSRT